MPELINVEKARAELDTKDLLTIERETALTWGGRAAASYDLSAEGPEAAERMRCFWEGETYRAEAVEHAAMTEDPRFLERVLVEVEVHRLRARQALLAEGHTFLEGSRTPAQARPLEFRPTHAAQGRPSPGRPTQGKPPSGPLAVGRPRPAGTQQRRPGRPPWESPPLGQRPGPRH